MFQASVTAKFHFEVAHWMPNFPEGHPNRRLHGHSYVAQVTVKGPVQADSGCVIDHGDMVALVKPVIDELDHRCLNDFPELELPTGECIARWIWRKLKPSMPLLHEVALVRESVGITISYHGEGA